MRSTRAASEERHASELRKLREQLAQAEGHAAQHSVRFEREVHEAQERARTAEAALKSDRRSKDELKKMCEASDARVGELTAQLSRVEAELQQRERSLEEARAALSRAEAEGAKLKAAHDEGSASWRDEESALRRTLAERDADLAQAKLKAEEQALALQTRQEKLQKTAQLGAQLADIQTMLTTLNEPDVT